MISLAKRTKEYLSTSEEMLRQLHSLMPTRITIFADEENLATVSMDYAQRIHSITCSENLFTLHSEMEIVDKFTRLINHALINSGVDRMKEIEKIISIREWEKIIIDENQSVRDNIELLKQSIAQSLREVTSRERIVLSKRGNITIVISGSVQIQSIHLDEQLLSVNNKVTLEMELQETINRAIHEIFEETRSVLHRNEEEFYQQLQQE